MFHTYKSFQLYIEACGDDPGLLGIPVEQASQVLQMPLKSLFKAVFNDQLDLVRVFNAEGSKRVYVPLRSLWTFSAKRAGRVLELPMPGLRNWQLAFEEWSLRRMLDGETDYRMIKT